MHVHGVPVLDALIGIPATAGKLLMTRARDAECPATWQGTPQHEMERTALEFPVDRADEGMNE